jgi:hypothetical protein
LSVGREAPHRYLVRSQADALQEESMSEAVRLGVIVPSVDIVVEEWHPIIDALEGIIGKPVVTSTQAVLRHLRLARVATPIHGFGRLLREH